MTSSWSFILQLSQREVWEVLKRRSEELEIAGEEAGLGTTDKITRVMNQTRGKCQIEPNTSAMLSDKWHRGSKLQIRVANRTHKLWPQGYCLQNAYLTKCSEQEWSMDVFPQWNTGSGRNTWRFGNTAVSGIVGVGNLSLSVLLARLKAFQLPWSAGL